MKRDKYDATFSDVVRLSAGYICEICGIESDPESMSNVRMECSHDISRRFVITRYDTRNAICSCSGCHRKTTDDPHFHSEAFIRIKGKDVVENNRIKAHSGERLKKFQKEDIREHYKLEQKRIHELRADGMTGPIELTVPECLK